MRDYGNAICKNEEVARELFQLKREEGFDKVMLHLNNPKAVEGGWADPTFLPYVEWANEDSE